VPTKSTRTKKYFFQLKKAVVFKFLALLASFVAIPVMLDFLGVEMYGIWSTLLSIVMWIVYFDLGLGNGLRNKVGIALAVNDIKLARQYISTTYILLACFSIIVFIAVFSVSNYIDWQSVFNSTKLSNNELKDTVLIILFFILFTFVSSLAIQIFYAIHRSEMSVVYQFIFNTLTLLSVLFLNIFTETNIILLALAYGLSMMLSSLTINYILFSEKRTLLPSFKFFDKTKLDDLFSLGLQFFIIQASLLIILSTDKIIITQIFGPSEVAAYDILYKLFTIVLVVHNIILVPMWSSFTDAFEKNDVDWIQKTIANLNLLMILFFAGILLLVVLAPHIIKVWIGTEVIVSTTLIIGMGIFSLLMVWNNIYGNFMNGISEMKPQLISYMVGGLLNIPMSIYFAKYVFNGVEGVIFASILSIGIFSVVGPLYTAKIIKNMSIVNK
jgi:O-antigen/teichoic acid export membrane protein